MPEDGERTTNLTVRGIPAQVRATLAARAQSQHRSLNSLLLELLGREAAVPTMNEAVAEIDAIRRPYGVSPDDAVAALRATREEPDSS